MSLKKILCDWWHWIIGFVATLIVASFGTFLRAEEITPRVADDYCRKELRAAGYDTGTSVAFVDNQFVLTFTDETQFIGQEGRPNVVWFDDVDTFHNTDAMSERFPARKDGTYYFVAKVVAPNTTKPWCFTYRLKQYHKRIS